METEGRLEYSVVVPVYNEEENLRLLHERLAAVLGGMTDAYEIILVDDGSRDSSAAIMKELAAKDSHVKYIVFSRNFGHEAASSAGLDKACGKAVVLMDADLQDPPEVIPELVARWREGFEIVYAQRSRREGETGFKKATSYLFYRTLNALSDVPLPLDAGDFRLMDGRVIAALKRCRETNRFVRGLVSWLGFRQTAVPYERPARHAGETKYGVLKMLALSADALSGFSTAPLRLAALLGFVTVVISGALSLAVVVHKLFFGLDTAGYALATAGMFFLGGVQMLLLGVVGEYVGKIFRQVQQRPLYLAREEHGWPDRDE